MKTNYLLLVNATVLTALFGCASAPEPLPELTKKELVNDFPTRDRVEYVLNCVAQRGGLSYINQYACGCKIDKNR
jgi:hypothetical protein